MIKSSVPEEERHYLRGPLPKKGSTLVIAALLLVLVVLLLVLIPMQSTAPWWTYLPLGAAWIVAVVLLLRTKTFYYINEAEHELQVAIVWSEKLRPVASLPAIYKAIWLPHTKEIKLTTARGDSFLKLRDGERFIHALQESYARLYPSQEPSPETLGESAAVEQAPSIEQKGTQDNSL